MTKLRGQYPPEFKLRAVAMMTEQGLSVADVARQLDVSESRPHEWKKAVREKGAAAFPGSGHPTPLEEESRNAMKLRRKCLLAYLFTQHAAGSDHVRVLLRAPLLTPRFDPRSPHRVDDEHRQGCARRGRTQPP